MGANSKIEWTDHTWNPWYGCSRASEGCDNCYAERWAKGTNIVDDFFAGPVRSKTRHRFPRSKHHKPGDFVFVCSLSDFFHEEAPDEWRVDALKQMAKRPELVFLLLTKRPHEAWLFSQAIAHAIPAEWAAIEKHRNVWLGVTAENQVRADQRIPVLVDIQWPGRKFVSVEPMIGPIDLRHWLCVYAHKGEPCCVAKEGYHPLGNEQTNTAVPTPLIDWVIVGGESGGNARPMQPDWARTLRDQCAASRGAIFSFKQWGEWAPMLRAVDKKNPTGQRYDSYQLLDYNGMYVYQKDVLPGDLTRRRDWMARIGKKLSGKLLDGKLHLDRPEPEVKA